MDADIENVTITAPHGETTPALRQEKNAIFFFLLCSARTHALKRKIYAFMHKRINMGSV